MSDYQRIVDHFFDRRRYKASQPRDEDGQWTASSVGALKKGDVFKFAKVSGGPTLEVLDAVHDNGWNDMAGRKTSTLAFVDKATSAVDEGVFLLSDFPVKIKRK